MGESDGNTWSIESDRTARGLGDVTAKSCIEQFKGLVEKLNLSEKEKQALLNLSAEMYLLGNYDIQKFIRNEVGIILDNEITGYNSKNGLKTLYDEIRPDHYLTFDI